MNIFNIFKKKQSNLQQEEQLESEIYEYNSNVTETIYGVVIKYNIISEDDIPVIIKICDFHCATLPDIDSIIWAPDKDKTKLEPYKVIRFDFIEDVDNNSNLYIVVTNANINDIAKYNNY